MVEASGFICEISGTKAAAAPTAALAYLSAGIALLPDDAWTTRLATATALHREALECEFLSGDAEAAEARFEAIRNKVTEPRDLADLYQLMIRIRHANNQIAEGMQIGIEVLGRLGVELPTEQERANAVLGELGARIAALLQERPLSEQLHAPRMTDPLRIMVQGSDAARVASSGVWQRDARGNPQVRLDFDVDSLDSGRLLDARGS